MEVSETLPGALIQGVPTLLLSTICSACPGCAQGLESSPKSCHAVLYYRIFLGKLLKCLLLPLVMQSVEKAPESTKAFTGCPLTLQLM